MKKRNYFITVVFFGSFPKQIRGVDDVLAQNTYKCLGYKGTESVVLFQELLIVHDPLNTAQSYGLVPNLSDSMLKDIKLSKKEISFTRKYDELTDVRFFFKRTQAHSMKLEGTYYIAGSSRLGIGPKEGIARCQLFPIATSFFASHKKFKKVRAKTPV